MLTLIFSKDRPAQLHCLLESIWENDKERIFEPRILYTYSSEEFHEGYKKCLYYWEQMLDHPSFIFAPRKEENFREDLLNSFINLDLFNQHGYLMMLVDDMILRKSIDISWEIMERTLKMSNMCCLSLRLGANTTWQYQTNSPISRMPSFNNREDGKILWWNRLSCSPVENFNYPLSTDGHIYKSSFIIPLIKQTQFKTPNQFEANLQQHVRKCPPFMSCPSESLFTNNVVNVCQYEYKNKFGEEFYYSLEELNEKYLSGQVIDYKNMGLENTRGCHQEFEIKWREE